MRAPTARDADRQQGERRLLIVQSNAFMARSLARYVGHLFSSVEAAATREEADAVFDDPRRTPSDLICGQDFGPDQPKGAELIADWRRRHPTLKHVVLATGASDLPPSLGGVDAVFLKPGDPRDLTLALARLLA